MENKDVLEFYKQTSQFTDLGYYKEFAKNLPNNIEELCVLQRMQIIHPVAYNDSNIRNKSNCFWGDMTKMPITRLDYEEDYFPTAQSIIAELLRKNPNYNIKNLFLFLRISLSNTILVKGDFRVSNDKISIL